MNDSCDTNPWDNVGHKALTDKIFLLCAPFNVIFNTLVLVIAFTFVNLKERLDQWFVINMTSSNLAFGLVYLIISPYSYNLPEWLCRPYYIIIWSCTASSVLFLLLLNIHKFITLFMPYKSERWVSKNKTFIQIAVVWIIVITYSITFATKLKFNTSDPCYECDVTPEPYMYASMMIGFYVCPLIVSLIISICIFALAQSKTKNPTGTSIGDDGQTFKRIFFVFSYTVFNALTFLPFRINYSVYIFCVLNENLRKFSKVSTNLMNPIEFVSDVHSDIVEDDVTPCLNEDLIYSLLCLLPFGSVINPLITIVTQRCYRNGVKKCFRSFINCITCKPPTGHAYDSDEPITSL